MQNKIIKSSIILLIIFIIGVFFIGLNKNSIYDTKNLVGQKITKIRLERFTGDRIITEEDLKKNNFTLINFWASWCAPCRLEHSFLMSLSEKYDLKILGINFKDNKENSLKFLKELGNPYYDIGKDVDGKVSIKFGVYGVPESILIDKNLKIIKKFIGPLDSNNLEEILEIMKIN